jgi:sialate O-acetylesterase
LKRWDKRVADYQAAIATASAPNAAPDPVAVKRRAGRDGSVPVYNPFGSEEMPANLYNSRMCPVMPFGIRGVIWYQGEENADRAYQYREMFPLMVKTWREKWGQGDFPFYWAQLADYMDEVDQPGESAWAELREAQTRALDSIPNSGQAVVIDLGDAADIHPRNKLDVGRRLARIALARDYGREDLVYQSPRFESMEIQGDRVLLRFKDVDRGLKKWDSEKVHGFALAGEDRVWVWCEARIVAPDQIQVRSDVVPDPVAVRYAWSDNPAANLYNMTGLPVTPFRTDDWPGVTADKK